MRKVAKAAEGAPRPRDEERLASRERTHVGVVRPPGSARDATAGSPDPVLDRGEETRRRMLMEHGTAIVSEYRNTSRAGIEAGFTITLSDLNGRDDGVRQIVHGPKKRGVSDVRVISVGRLVFRWAFPEELPAWLAAALRSPTPIPGLVVCLADGGATGGRLVYRPRLRQWVLVPSANGRPRAGSVIPITQGQ